MEGKIDKKGILFVSRKGSLWPCHCPFGSGERLCKDNCALFGEPNIRNDQGMADLSLCHKTIRFTKFTDERE